MPPHGRLSQRHGYGEIFRWEGVPTADAADVHFRKEL